MQNNNGMNQDDSPPQQENVNGPYSQQDMNLIQNHFSNANQYSRPPNVQNYSLNGNNNYRRSMLNPQNQQVAIDVNNNMNIQHMMYQQSLNTVGSMMASSSQSYTEDNQGDSSTTTSSSAAAHFHHPMQQNMYNRSSNVSSNIQPPQLQSCDQFGNALINNNTLGGVPIPPVPANASTAVQVHVAAAAAAAAAAPPKGYHGQNPSSDETSNSKGKSNTKRLQQDISNLTAEEKKQQNRERNREHAKSTRLRKKAYVSKLKELVDGLHQERSEEVRKRRVEQQHLAEVQRVRRTVINDFLQNHSTYESDPKKWSTILEDDFVLIQPVTPFRSFPKGEIEDSSDRERRKTKGVENLINDAASMSVMVESVGNRSARWRHIKRDEFLNREGTRTDTIRTRMPHSIVRQDSRLQHAISSLSSSSGYSTGNGSGGDSGEENKKRKKGPAKAGKIDKNGNGSNKRKKVSSSSSGGSGQSNDQQNGTQNLFHDYHAQPLPDPKLSSGESEGSNSLTGNDSDNAVVGKVYIDSSSEDEDRVRRSHRRKRSAPPANEIDTDAGVKAPKPTDKGIYSKDATNESESAAPVSILNRESMPSNLPANIAKTGGIFHNVRPVNVRPVIAPSNPRLSVAPVTKLPPFAGLGKTVPKIQQSDPNASVSRSNSSNSNSLPFATTQQQKSMNVEFGTGAKVSVQQPIIPAPVVLSSSRAVNIIGAINDTNSDDMSAQKIQAFYHVNEDDMCLTDNVLMCPYIFRTQDAVLCGALAECVMPGMLRASFSSRNKLTNIEMVYDAMGFMQQLGRASGNEAVAEIIPNSLEMSLQPTNDEPRVITTSKAPYAIVSANRCWTELTKFTQEEVEQQELTIIEGERTDPELTVRESKPHHKPNEIAQGRPACSTNIYYDKYGKAFIAFVASYPLTNTSNEVTHILHTFTKLPEYQ